jgi:hypothetical protein
VGIVPAGADHLMDAGFAVFGPFLVSLVGVNRQREEPDVQWKAAAFVRWHEPDDARVSSPVL